jgi:hypothetical protein
MGHHGPQESDGRHRFVHLPVNRDHDGTNFCILPAPVFN